LLGIYERARAIASDREVEEGKGRFYDRNRGNGDDGGSDDERKGIRAHA